MANAGLDASLDQSNNAFGHPVTPGPWLLLGSHTDTVPAGGRLDGAFGVIAALEIARSLPGKVAAVSFHDEEGVSGRGPSGSRLFCASPVINRIAGFLELHIEQGPVLDSEELELGVVDSIVGIDLYDVTIGGEPNHAGTTPFHLRRDAGRAAARLIAGLKDLVLALDPNAVATVGYVTLEPGASNVVPGVAKMTLEVRSGTPESLHLAREAIREELTRLCKEEGCEGQLTGVRSSMPIAMSQPYVNKLAAACQRSGRPWRHINSGAGHDAAVLARHVLTGMLFVPSLNGFSHSPREHTDDRLLVQGCQVLCDAAQEIAQTLG
jgi:N-carbamoyl-L-amino-acid hydrolase